MLNVIKMRVSQNQQLGLFLNDCTVSTIKRKVVLLAKVKRTSLLDELITDQLVSLSTITGIIK